MDDYKRRYEIAEHSIQEMKRFWDEMVIRPEIDEARVRAEMNKRTATNNEMKHLEELLARENLVGPYAQHCARYVILFKELVRRAAVEVRLGIKK